MIKQNVNIVGLVTLYNIFEEINDFLPFKVLNFNELEDFLNFSRENKIDLTNSLIITKIKYNENLINKNEFDKKNIFFLSEKKNNYEIINESNFLEYPLEIINLIQKINILLIKQKYNYQSKIKINDYYLDLNSRIISNKTNHLKLTEKEMNIILFLNENKSPQKINNLQTQVWGYSSELETHTVETHIYRLRKKINNNFRDDDFIISTDEGYIIK